MAICSFYAPHVGTELADRVSFWIQLRASIEEVLALHPRARLMLAGDSNIYVSEIMGSECERSGEPRLRELVRDLCRDFGLVIKNPPGVPTHRSGSAIDLVLTSQDLTVLLCMMAIRAGVRRTLVTHLLAAITSALRSRLCCPPLPQTLRPQLGHVSVIGGQWCVLCAPG